MKHFYRVLVCVLVALAAFGATSCIDINGGFDSTYSEAKLKIVNNYPSADGYVIKRVRFVGYDLEPLNIKSGEFQTFNLLRGMVGGYEKVYVIIYYGNDDNTYQASGSFNFKKYDTTKITLEKGSSSNNTVLGN